MSWQPRERFELVFCSFWLSHVPEERFNDFWARVRAALKPGGRVFLADKAAGGEGTHTTERATGEETRTIADGRSFRVVKHDRSPEELAARVRPLGVELGLRVTANGHVLVGGGS